MSSSFQNVCELTTHIENNHGNGYKVSANEAELYIDKVAAVAATTASDLEELATGMSKVASAANSLGVDVDQMNAMLATTISVTRQSPETVGVAYKTILARMSQLKVGGEDEDGTTLGRYTEQMRALGFDVIDQTTGQLRDMGDVVEEIGNKWKTLSKNQQIALAQVVAGNRQYNNLIALFDNWDKYEKALQTSANAAGTLNEQQDIFMESTEAHLQQMRTAAEGVYDSLLNNNTIQKFADGITTILIDAEKLTNSFGGLEGVLATLAPMFMTIFNTQMANTAINVWENAFKIPQQNIQQMQTALTSIQSLNAEINNIEGKMANQAIQGRLSSLAAGTAGLLSIEQVDNINKQITVYEQTIHELGSAEDDYNNKLRATIEILKTYGIDLKQEQMTNDNYRQSLAAVNNEFKLMQEALAKVDPSSRKGAAMLLANGGTGNSYIDAQIQNILNSTKNNAGYEKMFSRLENNLESTINKTNELGNSFLNLSNAERTATEASASLDQSLQKIDWTSTLSSSIRVVGSLGQIYNIGNSLTQTLKDLSNGTGNFAANLAKLSIQLTPLLFQFQRLKASGITLGNILTGGSLATVLNNGGLRGVLEARQAQPLLDNKAINLRNTAIMAHNAADMEAQRLDSLKTQQQANINAWRMAANAYNTNKNSTTLNALIRATSNVNNISDSYIKGVETNVSNLSKQAAEADKVAAAAEEAAESNAALSASFMTTVTSIGLLLVAVGAVVLAFIRIKNAATDTSKELENAQKAFNDASEAIKNTKEQFNTFDNTYTSIKNLSNELKKLTQGTDEYTETLQQLHNEINTLIENNPSLRFKAVWNNGGWEISDQALQDYQKELQNNINLATMAQTQAQIRLLNAEWDNTAKSIQGINNNILTIQWENAIGKRKIFENSGNSTIRDQIYSDVLKEEQEIQEQIILAKKRENEDDIKYWTTILDLKNKKIAQDKEEITLSKQMFDLNFNDKFQTMFYQADGSQTTTQAIQEEYFRNRMATFGQSYLNQETIKFLDNSNRNELYQSLKKRYAALYSVSENEVKIKDINKTGNIGIEIASKNIDIKLNAEQAASEGAIITANEKISSLDIDYYYQGLLKGKSASEILKQNLIMGYDYNILNYSDRDIQEFQNYARKTGFSTKYKNEYDNFIQLYENIQNAQLNSISSEVGRELLNLMKKVNSNLTGKEWEEYSLEIQKVYMKDGPKALEYFLTQLEKGKVEIKDFMTFDFQKEQDSLAVFEERFKALKVEESDWVGFITRQAKASGLTEKDIKIENKDFVDMILRRVEAQSNIDKMRKEDFFEILKLNDFTNSDFLNNLNITREAMQALFGDTDINDDFIIQYQQLINDYVNNIEGSTDKLSDAYRDFKNKIIESLPSYNEIFYNFNNILDQATTDTMDNSQLSHYLSDQIEELAKQLNFSDQQLEAIMAQHNFIKTADGWIKQDTISYTYGEKEAGEWQYLTDLFEQDSYLVEGYDSLSDMLVPGADGMPVLSSQARKMLEKAGYEIEKDDVGGFKIRIKASIGIEISDISIDKLKELVQTDAYGDKYIANVNDDIAISLGYTDVQNMLDAGWIKDETFSSGVRYYLPVALQTQLHDEEAIVIEQHESSYSVAAVGANKDKFARDYLHLSSWEEAKEQGWFTQISNNMLYYVQKVGVITEIDDKGIVDAAGGGKNNEEETTIAKYVKKIEWEETENSYNQKEQQLKDNEQQISYLKEIMEDQSGDALLQTMQKENDLLTERVDIYKELNKQDEEKLTKTNSELEALAKKYGVIAEFDEYGNPTQKFADALWAAEQAAEKAAYDANYSAEEAYNAIDSDKKNKNKKQEAENDKTKAGENLENVKKDREKIAKLLKESSDLVYDIHGREIKILQTLKEQEKIKISEIWVKTDDAIKQSAKDIEHINTIISEMNKETEYLDFDEKMKNAKKVGELQQRQAQDYKDQIQLIYKTVTDNWGDMLKKDGINIEDLLSMDPVKISEMLMDIDDRILQIKSDTSLSDEARSTLLGQYEGIRERLEDAVSTGSKYNDILRETKVNTNKVKEATDQIETSKIEHTITQLNRELNVLKKTQSDLKGQALINNLKQQLAIQQKIVVQEQKKLTVMKQQTHELATQMQQQFAEVGISAQIKFNEDGSLANYYEIVALIEKAVGLSRQKRDILLDKLNILNKSADAQAKQFDQLQSAKDNATDLAKQIKKAIQEELKNTFNAKVDVELNIEEAWRQLHKLRAELQGLKDTDYLGNINLQMQQFQEYLRTNPNSTLPGGSLEILTQHLNDIMTEIGIMQGGGTSSIYGTDQSAAFSDLENYRNQLASTSQAAMDAVKEMKQTYLSAIDALITANNNYIASLEQMNTILNNTSNIIKLVYGENAYARIQKYLDGQISVNQQMAMVARQNANDYYIRAQNAQTKEETEKWLNAWKDAVNQYYQYSQKVLEAYKQSFDNMLNDTAEKAKGVWSTGIGANGLMFGMDWELEKKKTEDWYDYTNSLFQRNTLQAKIAEDIEKASVAAAQKLAQAETEIIGRLNEQLRLNKQLSKYEVDRANKLYELTKKQIALEEARENKTKMRLRRDSAGNYRYEYVADEDKVDKAQQEVDKAENDMYNFYKDAITKAVDKDKALKAEFGDKLKEIFGNKQLTPEQQAAQAEKLWDMYFGAEGFVTRNAQTINQALTDIQPYSQGGIDEFLNEARMVASDTPDHKIIETLSQTNGNYRAMSEALAEEIEGYSVSDLDVSREIADYNAAIAEDMKTQVDQIAQVLEVLASYEVYLNGLLESAMGTYEASLYLREKSDAASKAAADDKASGAAASGGGVAPRDDGATVDYYVAKNDKGGKDIVFNSDIISQGDLNRYLNDKEKLDEDKRRLIEAVLKKEGLTEEDLRKLDKDGNLINALGTNMNYFSSDQNVQHKIAGRGDTTPQERQAAITKTAEEKKEEEKKTETSKIPYYKVSDGVYTADPSYKAKEAELIKWIAEKTGKAAKDIKIDWDAYGEVKSKKEAKKYIAEIAETAANTEASLGGETASDIVNTAASAAQNNDIATATMEYQKASTAYLAKMADKDFKIEQNVEITPNFPGVKNSNEIIDAFNKMKEQCTQKISEDAKKV